MTDLAALRARYETELFDRVLPFWERHAPDRTHGGTFNNLGRDGRVFDTTKHMWLQGRLVWMFASLYNHTEPRPEWLALARSGMDFMRAHAVRPDGRVYFALRRDGQPAALQRKIFSECFYVMALAEYARATDDAALAREAHEGLERLFVWAENPAHVGRPALPGEAPAQALAVPMILLNLIDEVAQDDAGRYAAEIDALIRRMLLHVDDGGIVRETVAPDGSLLGGPAGRLLNPGHALEAGWFLMRWAERLGRADLTETAVRMIRAMHARGWDAEHGGLFYFLDADGLSPTPLEWPMKLWWPHCEALIAHLMAFRATGDPADKARFAEVDRYAFAHFPDPEHGEWYGYLDREGRVTHTFKGGPYKGCFHVPRALRVVSRLLGEMETERAAAPPRRPPSPRGRHQGRAGRT